MVKCTWVIMSKCIQTKLLKFDVAFGIFCQYFVGEFWYLKNDGNRCILHVWELWAKVQWLIFSSLTRNKR